ncbi:phiSA1p31-related protein [Streptomyces sp. NBC_01768]|uniref:phiSA1p31-related protein n=1 Tax=Streptomyces sp. NBC_01768 TaxID=2975938 RepID=UPI002DDB8583|nr:phiSA1p31-related protein [Streptomyces sp. NBC_01768]WSC31816.1 phiSA1p31-related protein [Streptomyces sp. NBC_01768]
MAKAQYETRTRTVEETVVVLTLTEDEANELRHVAGTSRRIALRGIYHALRVPSAPEPETSADTFELYGIVYEIGAVYRDAEGDHFDFKAELSAPGTPDNNDDGTPIGRFRGRYADGDPNKWGWSLREVVENHGPLTKVTT